MRYILDHTVWMDATSWVYLIGAVLLFAAVLLISWKKIHDLKKQEKNLEEQLSSDDSARPAESADLNFMDDYYKNSPEGKKA